MTKNDYWYRKDWWVWRLHVIRYRLTQEKYWGIQFSSPIRFRNSWKLRKSLEVFTGKHVYVFYWTQLD